ncbi:hypothetical protein [Rummeliibacillus sp. TYF-LIM-RU47]|uniref:hypothetical protein n=1 Tax=Rummeliibacillus sp. TYF-LIM-RU47 TaxID=2608406 RepID=UPI0012395820|nr:hypothetical protein [Rummeliibacillus sp. TYF-LIM-RU47]
MIFLIFAFFILSVLLVGIIFLLVFLVSFIQGMIANKRNGLPLLDERMKNVVLVAIVVIACMFFYEVYH